MNYNCKTTRRLSIVQDQLFNWIHIHNTCVDLGSWRSFKFLRAQLWWILLARLWKRRERKKSNTKRIISLNAFKGVLFRMIARKLISQAILYLVSTGRFIKGTMCKNKLGFLNALKVIYRRAIVSKIISQHIRCLICCRPLYIYWNVLEQIELKIFNSISLSCFFFFILSDSQIWINFDR